MARRSSIMVSKTLYQIGVITLITAMIWALIGIYIVASKTTIVDVDQTILEPINPNLDQEVIQKLRGRLKIEVDLTATSISSESATILEGGADELVN